MSPDPEQLSEQAIQRAVAELRTLVSGCSTVSVAGASFLYHLRRDTSELQSLYSPARQWSFLLGLLLEAPEPDEPREYGPSDQATAEVLLNNAFSGYATRYYPDPEKRADLSEEWWRVRDVVLPAFLHYFNSGLLASAEQVESRIRQYVVPFDEAVRDELGIAPSEALAIAKWIGKKLQSVLDDTSAAFREEKAARVELLDRLGKDWSLEEFRKAAAKPEYHGKLTRLVTGIQETALIRLPDLEEAFPHTGRCYWDVFTVERGDGPTLMYPTERSIADDRPLIRVSADQAMCPSMPAVYMAILERSEELLGKGPTREKYFRARDKTLEGEVAEHLGRMVGSDCTVYSGLFETEHQQYEHDVIVLCSDLCLIAESKARAPKEPFRDPEKAFVRLERAFKSEKGIQGGYEQALRIWRRLAAGEDVPLYDEAGGLVVTIPKTVLENAYCVVATRDDFGPLGTDLDLLLSKDDAEPYPWVVNALDLEGLADAWGHFGWGPEQLGAYLKRRIQLHGKLMSGDELEVAGYFVRHGGLETLVDAEMDRMSLDPTYSAIFDQLYSHIHHGGPPVEIEIVPPVVTDLGASLRAGEPVFIEPRVNPTRSKVGRNDPCPCGSGKKYKKCCGGPGRRSG